MGIDISYWGTLVPPLAPSDEDVSVFLSQIVGKKTVLLGCTKQLMPISSVAIDSDPYYEDPKIIISNWQDYIPECDTVIGDGVFNIVDQSVADDIVQLASQSSKRLVVRSFIRKEPIMRLAFSFPEVKSFTLQPKLLTSDGFANFFVWDF